MFQFFDDDDDQLFPTTSVSPSVSSPFDDSFYSKHRIDEEDAFEEGSLFGESERYRSLTLEETPEFESFPGSAPQAKHLYFNDLGSQDTTKLVSFGKHEYKAKAMSWTQASPLPVPEFVEPYTSFKSTESLECIFDRVIALLERKQIDFEEQFHECSIKGITFAEQKPCTWKFTVYQPRGEEGYLCELQRRSGDFAAFHELFRRIQSALSPHGKEKTRQDTVFGFKSDLEALAEVCFTHGKIIEGLRCIAILSERDPSALERVKDISVVISTLSSDNREAQRLSTLIVSNAAAAKVKFQRIDDKDIHGVTETMALLREQYATCSFLHAATRRNTERFFGAMAPTLQPC